MNSQLTSAVVREHGLVEDGSKHRRRNVRQRGDRRVWAAAGVDAPDGERHEPRADVAGRVRGDWGCTWSAPLLVTFAGGRAVASTVLPVPWSSSVHPPPTREKLHTMSALQVVRPVSAPDGPAVIADREGRCTH